MWVSHWLPEGGYNPNSPGYISCKRVGNHPGYSKPTGVNYACKSRIIHPTWLYGNQPSTHARADRRINLPTRIGPGLDERSTCSPDKHYRIWRLSMTLLRQISARVGADTQGLSNPNSVGVPLLSPDFDSQQSRPQRPGC
jgi:hypothetical protein